jgi:Tfp pilus assembly protein PilN
MAEARATVRLRLNILPERHRRPRIRIRELIPWALAAALAVWMASSVGPFTDSRRALMQAEAEVARALARAATVSRSGVEAEALRRRIDAAQQRADQIRQAHASVGVRAVDWSGILRSVFATAPDGVVLTRVRQEGPEVAVEGEADEYGLVLEFARRLESNGTFPVVLIRSVVRLPEPEPTETAAGEVEAPPPPLFAFVIELQIAGETDAP